MYSFLNSPLPVPYDAAVQALALPICGVSVRAGFPSPADDFVVERLDIMKLLVKHPQATYFWRVRGDSMRDAGIEDGSIIAVDRAIKPKHNSIVVAIVDGECTVKYLHQRAGRIKLRAANPTYPDIIPRESQTIEVWGVVSGLVLFFVTNEQVLDNACRRGICYFRVIVGLIAVWNDSVNAIPDQQRSLECVEVTELDRWIVQCL